MEISNAQEALQALGTLRDTIESLHEEFDYSGGKRGEEMDAEIELLDALEEYLHP